MGTGLLSPRTPQLVGFGGSRERWQRGATVWGSRSSQGRSGAGESGFAGATQAGRGREEEAVCSPGGQYSGSSCHGNCAAVPDAANFEVHPGWNQPKNNNKTLWVLRWIGRITVVSCRRMHPCCHHAPGTWQPSWTFMGLYKWV